MTQIAAFGWTLAIEIPIVVLMMRHVPLIRTIPIGAGASLLTHPFAWYFASLLSFEEYNQGVYIIEMSVLVIEGIWYRYWFDVTWKRAIMVSAVANTTSFLVGWMGL